MIWTLTTQARIDLIDIWKYIAEDSVQSADQVSNRLLDAFDRLAENPRLGHARRDLTRAAVLFWPVGSFVVVYRLKAEILEIIAVTRGGRDLPTLIQGR